MKWEYQALVLTHPGFLSPLVGKRLHYSPPSITGPEAHGSLLSSPPWEEHFHSQDRKPRKGHFSIPRPLAPTPPPPMRTAPRAMCRVTSPSAACLSEDALILHFLTQLLSGAALTSQVSNKCGCERETTGLHQATLSDSSSSSKS